MNNQDSDYNLKKYGWVNMDKCLECGSSLRSLRKKSPYGSFGIITAKVCTKPSCFHSLDLSKLDTWVDENCEPFTPGKNIPLQFFRPQTRTWTCNSINLDPISRIPPY